MQVKEKTFAATTTTSATHQEQTVLTQEVQKTRKLIGGGDGDSGASRPPSNALVRLELGWTGEEWQSAVE